MKGNLLSGGMRVALKGEALVCHAFSDVSLLCVRLSEALKGVSANIELDHLQMPLDYEILSFCDFCQ